MPKTAHLERSKASLEHHLKKEFSQLTKQARERAPAWGELLGSLIVRAGTRSCIVANSWTIATDMAVHAALELLHNDPRRDFTVVTTDPSIFTRRLLAVAARMSLAAIEDRCITHEGWHRLAEAAGRLWQPRMRLVIRPDPGDHDGARTDHGHRLRQNH